MILDSTFVFCFLIYFRLLGSCLSVGWLRKNNVSGEYIHICCVFLLHDVMMFDFLLLS